MSTTWLGTGRALALALALVPVPAAVAADPVVDEEPSDEFVPESERARQREMAQGSVREPMWGHLTVGLGVRQIGEDEAGFAMSLEADLQRKGWPVGLLFNMNVAIADGPTLTDPWFGTETTNIEMLDFGLGARKVFARGKPVQPFLSVGGSVYFASVDTCEYWAYCSESLDDDVTFGPFADGGVFFVTRGVGVLGFRVRYSVGDVTLLGREVALDGVDVQVSWGMRF